MDTNLSLGPKGDRHLQHGSYMYNLGKVLNFTSRRKKLLKLVKLLEKYFQTQFSVKLVVVFFC